MHEGLKEGTQGGALKEGLTTARDSIDLFWGGGAVTVGAGSETVAVVKKMATEMVLWC